MLLQQEARDVTPVGVMKTARATVKASAKVFDMFATQTYSDVYGAIVRELTANAIDAHTAAGKNETPVKIWLPDDIDPYFRVTDQGIGMSEEFMLGQFMAYTDGSTKDQSNDQIGGFGIGSKSPFAYTDQFVVASTFEGVRSTYSVFKDVDGIPSIAMLDQCSTDDANGVEVSFPVEQVDFYKFYAAADRVIPYFTPLPNVVNRSIEAVAYNQQGSGWGITNGERTLSVVMGGVRYKVDSYEVGDHLLKECGVDLYLPIGAVSITPSRESLLYNDATKATIVAALDGIVDEVVASMPTMFDKEPSLWAATLAMHKEVGGNYHSGRGKLVAQYAQWRGQKLEQTIKPSAPGGAEAWPWELQGRKTLKVPAARFEFGRTVTPSRFKYVIFDDLEDRTSVSRIRRWADEVLYRGEWVLVLRGDNALEAYGNPQDVILVSELEKPVPIRRPTSKGQRPRVRMFRYTESSKWGAKWRDHMDEIAYEDQPLDGVLVVMDNFDLRDSRDKILSGIVPVEKLCFVNKGDAPKLRHFTAFKDAYKEAFAEALGRYPTLPQAMALLREPRLQILVQYTSRYAATLASAKPSTPLGKLLELYRTYIEPARGAPAVLQQAVAPKLPPRLNVDRLVDAFETKQWRAKALLDDNYLNEAQLRLLKEFI